MVPLVAMAKPPTPLAIAWEKVPEIRRKAQKLQVATQTGLVVGKR